MYRFFSSENNHFYGREILQYIARICLRNEIPRNAQCEINHLVYGLPMCTHDNCGNVRYNTHLYCLAVQAGFYSDMVECWLRILEVPGSILGRGKRYLALFHLLRNHSLKPMTYRPIHMEEPYTKLHIQY